LILVVVFAGLLASCSVVNSPGDSLPDEGTVFDAAFDAPPAPDVSANRVASGRALYGQYCASCHMADLSGAPDWKTPLDDGTYPPPPHDSTGHTWHHPDRLLLEIVRDGLDDPSSTMPTFNGVLEDNDILAIVDYLRSTWGTEERAFQWQLTWQDETSRD
jgi:mono/diheme cytochrome c family protein